MMATQEPVQIHPPEAAASLPPTMPYAWVVLFVAYIASIVCTINMMKVAPLMPDLMMHFRVDLTSAGLMMSVVAFTGLILGLPAGVIVQKFGIKVVGILAMSVSIVGCALGALATNYPVFLISRALEGVGFALIALVGATTAGIWFPPHRIGLAMGLISTCMGVGGFVTMAAAPRMAHLMGWHAVWWLTTAISFVSLLSVIAFVRMPPWMTAVAPGAGAPPPGPSLSAGFANRNIWLWAAAYLCIFLPSAVFMYYVTFLTKVQGYTMENAGLVSSLGSVGLLVGAPLGGILIGRIGHLKLMLGVGVVLYCLLLTLAFNISGIAIPIWMVVMGAVGMGFIPTVCMTAVPGIMGNPQLMGLGMAIAGFGANLAGMIGPPLFGSIVEKAGWNAGAYTLIPVALLGVLFAAVTRIQQN